MGGFEPHSPASLLKEKKKKKKKKKKRRKKRIRSKRRTIMRLNKQKIIFLVGGRIFITISCVSP